jgi:hypothetical protein
MSPAASFQNIQCPSKRNLFYICMTLAGCIVGTGLMVTEFTQSAEPCLALNFMSGSYFNKSCAAAQLAFDSGCAANKSSLFSIINADGNDNYTGVRSSGLSAGISARQALCANEHIEIMAQLLIVVAMSAIGYGLAHLAVMVYEQNCAADASSEDALPLRSSLNDGNDEQRYARM